MLSRSKQFLNRNASTILTFAGGAGVVATTILGIDATRKAVKLLDQAEKEKGEKLTKTEVVQVAGPTYIPTIITGVSTLACIFGANVLNKRKQATLVSAYALLDNSYKEYKKKVGELYGEEGQERIVEEIAKDKYEETDIVVSPDKQLFYDEFLGQYFESTIEAVQRAEYELNRDIQTQGCATLAEYYIRLGIEDYDDGGALGWSEGGNFARYWQSWVDFSHNKTLIDDDLECIIITMWSEPYMDYQEY